MSSTATITSVTIVVVLACAKSTVSSAFKKACSALPSGRDVETAPGSLANHSTATSTKVPSAICQAAGGAPGWSAAHWRIESIARTAASGAVLGSLVMIAVATLGGVALNFIGLDPIKALY